MSQRMQSCRPIVTACHLIEGKRPTCFKTPLQLLPLPILLLLHRLHLYAGSLQAMQPARWEYPTSLGRQFCSLLWREVLAITRNPFDLAGRWVGVPLDTHTQMHISCT